MKQPRWLVCERCQTVRAGRYTEHQPGWRVIPPGHIHDADTCTVYPDAAAYRAALGAPTGSTYKETHA